LGLATVSILTLGAALVPVGTGALGILFGSAYLRSPTWKLEVVVDDDGIEVRRGDVIRFRVAWTDIVRVVASPSTHTCFIDSGTPESSLLVPGVGAPAPYAIEDRDALYDAILAHVDAAKVTEVATLEAR
jgi:hypothetical protein